MTRNNTRQKIIVGLAAVINIIGGFIALGLRLPIYLDTIGTLFIAVIYGPLYGIATALVSGLISGSLFDIYSIYFAPASMIAALIAGLLYRGQRRPYLNRRTPIEVLLFTLPGTIVSSYTAAYIFGGQTSSGSAILVQIINKMGLNLVASVFIIQIFTEYIDRFISILLVFALIKKIPGELLYRER